MQTLTSFLFFWIIILLCFSVSASQIQHLHWKAWCCDAYDGTLKYLSQILCANQQDKSHRSHREKGFCLPRRHEGRSGEKWDSVSVRLCSPWILQARILAWEAFSFSRGSSPARDLTQVSRIAGDSLPAGPPGKPKNTGVRSLSVLQGIFPSQESNQSLLCCRRALYHLSYEGSPIDNLRLRNLMWSWLSRNTSAP